jgi:putative addiction module killer protein
MIHIIQTHEFSEWLSSLKDRKAFQIILDRIARIQEGNWGDVQPVGEGISEARIHYGAGYRLYFMQRGNKLVVMLGGGNKSHQARDIKKAKALASEWGNE